MHRVPVQKKIFLITVNEQIILGKIQQDPSEKLRGL